MNLQVGDWTGIFSQSRKSYEELIFQQGLPQYYFEIVYYAYIFELKEESLGGEGGMQKEYFQLLALHFLRVPSVR